MNSVRERETDFPSFMSMIPSTCQGPAKRLEPGLGLVEIVRQHLDFLGTSQEDYTGLLQQKEFTFLYTSEDFQSSGTYSGGFDGSMRQGLGQMTYSDGSLYCGEWKSDKKNGQGIYVFDENMFYKGSFLQDKPSGLGELLVLDKGTIFKGSFEQGLRHGYGTLQQADRSYERGSWILGKREGPFVVKTTDKDIRRWTYWENGSEVC